MKRGVEEASSAAAKRKKPRVPETSPTEGKGKVEELKCSSTKRSSPRIQEAEKKKKEEEEEVKPPPASKKGNTVGCHQCRKCVLNDGKSVVECHSCRKKNYCVSCLKRWYPCFREGYFAEKCPFCRNNCNCKPCLRMQGIPEPPIKVISQGDKIRYSQYIICLLLPFLKEMRKEQMTEKEAETNIRGLVWNGIKVKQVDCEKNVRTFCNHCMTSIVDLHRSCRNCTYDLCLSCGWELREGHPIGWDRTIPVEYEDRGKDYLHGGTSHPQRKDQDDSLRKYVETTEKRREALKKWKIKKGGTIPCPPKILGGCGKSILELKCMFAEAKLQDLEEKAEEITRKHEFGPFLDISAQCSCFSLSGQINSESKAIRKASSREDSDDNFLYCPTAMEIEGQLSHFQRHWVRGEPVIVRNVLDLTSGLSWEPMVMWRAFREPAKSRVVSDSFTVNAIDCLDFCKVDINIHQFFTGYTEGRSHQNQWPEMLKLKDWPPASFFKERLARHGAEFMTALPFPEYTDPRGGFLNLASKLPEGVLKPDLGPKTYIGYGFPEELVRGDSVTKIHCDMSDAVNILMHTAEVTWPASQLSEIEKLKERHRDQDIKEQLCSSQSDLDVDGKIIIPSEASNIHSDIILAEGEMLPVGTSSLESSLPKMVPLSVIKSQPSFDKQCGDDISTRAEPFVNNLGDSSTLLQDENDLGLADVTMDIPKIEGKMNNESGKFSILGEKKNKSHASDEGLKETEVSGENKTQKPAVSVENMEPQQTECGALWDIFRREDANKLQEYLRNHAKEFRHTFCNPVEKKVVHPIHDQSFYLTLEHKRKLKEEFGIEPWTFEQNLGEAVLIPAGCPHQVRNLKSCIKVAVDFVSPENIRECIRLTDEFRLLPEDHVAKEDRLEVKKMALHALIQAIKVLENTEQES